MLLKNKMQLESLPHIGRTWPKTHQTKSTRMTYHPGTSNQQSNQEPPEPQNENDYHPGTSNQQSNQEPPEPQNENDYHPGTSNQQSNQEPPEPQNENDYHPGTSNQQSNQEPPEPHNDTKPPTSHNKVDGARQEIETLQTAKKANTAQNFTEDEKPPRGIR